MGDRRLPLPQRALEMHRRTGRSLDDCLVAVASEDAWREGGGGISRSAVNTPRVRTAASESSTNTTTKTDSEQRS